MTPRDPTVSADPDPAYVQADIALAAGEFDRAVDMYGDLLRKANGPAARAHVQCGLAEALCRTDRGGEAIAHAAAAAAAFEAQGSEGDSLYAQYWLAYGHYQQDDLDTSRSILMAVLDQVRAGASVAPDFRFRILTALASAEARQGQHSRAIAYLHEAEALTGDVELRKRASFLGALAIAYREAGDLEASIVTGIEALGLYDATAIRNAEAGVANNLAITYLKAGNASRAAEMAARARALASVAQDDRFLATVRETEAEVALARERVSDARRLAWEAVALGSQTGNASARASALQTLAAISLQEGDPNAAVTLLESSVAILRATTMRGRLQEGLTLLAETLEEVGDSARANAAYAEAIRVPR